MSHYLLLIIAAILLSGCTKGKPAPKGDNAGNGTVQVPAFSGDSAFAAVARQLEFGPRVPGTQAQEDCARWLQQELTRYGAVVTEQRSTVTAYDGRRYPCINIMGSYNPEASHRILLMAHWDSRPMADEDPDPARRNEPVMAANDGASGVGVLLEIARQASLRKPRAGIDIFFTDVEDNGAPSSWTGPHNEEAWGLGTQQWCREARRKGYKATYGILLDMVGSGDATFYREYYSDYYASDVVNHVWKTAARLGYRNLFIDRKGGGITDDHVFVNRMTDIPTIDIIDTRMDGEGTFYPYWHTTDDTLDKISTETLRKVGDVLMHLIY